MQPWQYFKDAGSARAFLAHVRIAVRELDQWRYIMDEGAAALSVSTDGPRGGGISNPTESLALFLAEQDAAIRDNAREQYSYCIEIIGAGLIAVETVRRGLGDKYGDIIEGYYIDAFPFSTCAELCQCSKSTAIERRDIACDYLDSIPILDIFRPIN